MKKLITLLFIIPFIGFAQEKVASGVYTFTEDAVLINGETTFFEKMNIQTIKIKPNEVIKSSYKTKEQIVIVKEGKIEVTIDKETKTIGANSIAFVLPKDEFTIKNTTNKPAVYYQMIYNSKEGIDMSRGEGEIKSFIIDFDELEFNPHDKGGIRNYFHTSTAMLDYYEMHVTNLNAGIKSHEPHTHKATEIVLMIKGNTQMEIGDKIYKGNAGDIYFLASDIPHAIENIGDEQCMYFAFQWD